VRLRILVALLALAGILLAVFVRSGAPPAAGAAGVIVTYKAGWNLVGGPDGTVFNAASNAYTLAAGDTAYESAPATTPVTAGKSYWIFFPSDTAVTLNGAGIGTLRQTLPAGQFVMVGNPSGVQAVALSGADQVLSYDPVSGYQTVTQLAVGQGAWVLSANGGTLTMTATGAPLPIPSATPSPSPAPASAPPPAAVEPTASSGSGGVIIHIPDDCHGSTTLGQGAIRNAQQMLSLVVTGLPPNDRFAFVIYAVGNRYVEYLGKTDASGSFSGQISFTPLPPNTTGLFLIAALDLDRPACSSGVIQMSA
jgi:hypothetical protein